MPSPILSTEQLRRLRGVLSRCDEIASHADLIAIFADQRLLLWRPGLRETNNLKARVDQLIDYMRERRNTARQSGLVLLLWVLADKYDSADERHDNLLSLASELAYGVRVILPPNSPSDPQLERKIRTSNGMFDTWAWVARLAAVERCICRVSVPLGDAAAYGTGFLLAPDIVITNYHVVERVITGKIPPVSVDLLFDYHIREDGVTPNVGPSYKLAAHDWLIDSSPYSPLDLKDASSAVPEPDQLDYALLRVAGSPGNELVDGAAAGSKSVKRSHIALPSADHPFAPNTPLFIVQYPDGKERKLAIDTDAIIGVNSNGTRVRYRTNTEPGSSGSPCFDANWNLVALHHGGDPNYAALHQPGYNQGIPFAAIVSLLRQHGKLGLLTGTA